MTHSVLDDHRRLREAIVALESAVRTGSAVATRRGVVAGCLVSLRHELARHFAAEEEGGLFEQIERKAPETTETCARLRTQHTAILVELDRLRDSLPRTGAPSARGASWAASVRALLVDVKDHEQREDELLLAALERTGGAPD